MEGRDSAPIPSLPIVLKKVLVHPYYSYGVNFDLLALNPDLRMLEPHLTLSLPSIITHKIMIKLQTGKYSFDLTITVNFWCTY